MSNRIEQLQKLLEAEPNEPFCLYGLAQEFAKVGEAERAIEFFERTIEADPNYCYAYYHLGRVLEEEGETDRARGVLQSGLERARAAGDEKAAEEIQQLLDVL